MMQRAVILANFFASAHGYASGSGTCSHLLDTITEMTDRTRETGAGSFTIETNVPAGGYDASTGYDITLSNGGAAFEGFLLYATQAADVAGTVRRGDFTVAADDNFQAKSCGGTGDSSAKGTITHKNGDAKTSVVAKWTAGSELGDISFYGIGYAGRKFYSLGPVTVKGPSAVDTTTPMIAPFGDKLTVQGYSDANCNTMSGSPKTVQTGCDSTSGSLTFSNCATTAFNVCGKGAGTCGGINIECSTEIGTKTNVCVPNTGNEKLVYAPYIMATCGGAGQGDASECLPRATPGSCAVYGGSSASCNSQPSCEWVNNQCVTPAQPANALICNVQTLKIGCDQLCDNGCYWCGGSCNTAASCLSPASSFQPSVLLLVAGLLATSTAWV